MADYTEKITVFDFVFKEILAYMKKEKYMFTSLKDIQFGNSFIVIYGHLSVCTCVDMKKECIYEKI